MNDSLAGKHTVVTAAGAGIGRATAIAFAREGANVTAVDIDGNALRSLAEEAPSIETSVLDVTNGDAVFAFAARHRNIAVLVNAVGWVAHGAILDCAESDLARSLDVNVTSMYRTVLAVLPSMLECGGGSIINIASIVSSLKGAKNRFAYGCSKGAVIGLTKSVAADYVSRGIRCNAICPGTVDTPSLSARMAATVDPIAARTEFLGRQPMGRLGKPDEIAALALYLASDSAAFTTGQTFVVDGGWSI